MTKDIVLSANAEPQSPKYIVWQMDRLEADQIKLAVGIKEDQYPLLTTLADYH